MHGVNYGVDLSNDHQYVLVFSEGSLTDVRVYDSKKKVMFPKDEERKIIIDEKNEDKSWNVLTLHFNRHSRVDSVAMESIPDEGHKKLWPAQHPNGARIARAQGQYLERPFSEAQKTAANGKNPAKSL